MDGVLLLDKPIGMSSNGALQKARWLFNAEKAGHTGTLDPLATGLLPLCFGEATKFSAELLDADKSYRASVKLGVTTDTADSEGRVLETRPVAVTPGQLAEVLTGFVGEIEQVPPMYSALKRDGKPLYEYARAGIEVERAARKVTISDLRLLSFGEDTFEIEVDCSKGTYIRTLAADIGAALDCGAHLIALRRIRIGRLGVGDALTIEGIETIPPEARDACLAPVDSLVQTLPRTDLAAEEAVRVGHGQAIRRDGVAGGRWRLYGPDGGFLGLAEQSADGWLQPKRLLSSNADGAISA